MSVDERAVRIASEVLRRLLKQAADEQQAYFHSFDNGHVSLELEWLDLTPLLQAAIVEYLASAQTAEPDLPLAASGGG
jgi:hypothetical protein